MSRTLIDSDLNIGQSRCSLRLKRNTHRTVRLLTISNALNVSSLEQKYFFYYRLTSGRFISSRRINEMQLISFLTIEYESTYKRKKRVKEAGFLRSVDRVGGSSKESSLGDGRAKKAGGLDIRKVGNHALGEKKRACPGSFPRSYPLFS